jgi:DNA-binding winged helix-turn-helix (wHTH) protein/tetratricopeptide (TPR) repeat protein
MDPLLRHVQLGPVHVDLGARRVRREGAADARLTPIEHRLLTRLLSATGAAVSQEDLLREVWGYRSTQTRTLATTVRRLRSKIEVNPHKPEALVTVPNLGYRLQCETPATSDRRVEGRRAEVDEVLSASRDARVVSLVGPPGAGTASVARSAAEALGAVRVAYTGEGWRDLAHGMGWPVVVPDADSVGALISRAGSLTVWLDREPDGPAVDPAFITALLTTNQHLKLLVDAGRPLWLPDERVVTCNGLPLADARLLLGAGHPDTLDAIAVAVDALPVALTLLRPWVERLGADEVLRLLQEGSSFDPTLQHLVNGALVGLPDVALSTLQALATFHEGAGLQDLCAVVPGAIDGVAPLVDRRLVQRSSTNQLRCTALVRQSLRARGPSAADAAFTRHLASFGSPEALRLVTAVGDRRATARLFAVRHDLPRAHDLALSAPQPELAASIALAAAAAAGRWGDADRAATMLEQTLPHLPPGRLAAQVAGAWCELQRAVGRAMSVKLQLPAATSRDEPELTVGRAWALCGLGDLDQARDQLLDALATMSAASDLAGRAHAMLSVIASAQGPLDAAERHLREAMTIQHGLGHARRTALLLPRAAVLEMRLGRSWQPTLTEARRAIEALDDTEGLAILASAAGYLWACHGSHDRAHEAFIEAAERYHELGHVENAMRMTLDGAGSAINLGAWDEPWEIASAVLPIARRRGDRQAEARALYILGDLCWRRNDPAAAKTYLLPAASLAVQANLLEEIQERLASCS